MEWQPIDLHEASQIGIFNYESGFAPNVHPDLVWNDPKGQRPRILIHRGNLKLPSLSFDTNRFVSPEADMLIVDGNLTIDGDLDVEQFDVGTPGYLFVKGDLTVTNVFLAQQFELMVSGDIKASGIVLGEERSTGFMRCNGKLTAPITVMANFSLNAGAAEGTIFAQHRPGDSDTTDVRLSNAEAERVVGVEEDEVTGQFWLLDLPEGVSQDEIETDEELAGYSILTGAALADYQGAGGELAIKDVLKKHGPNGFRSR